MDRNLIRFLEIKKVYNENIQIIYNKKWISCK
jgi:hypothetical protein